MAGELPPNWRAAKDSDGKEYYFNELTGETSWSFPEGDKKPASSFEASSPPVNPIAPSMASDSAEFAPSEEPPMPSYGNGGKANFGRTAPGASGISATLGSGVMTRVCIMMFCSVVVLLQSAIYLGRTTGDGAAESYGIAVGSVSLGFSVIFVAIAKYKPSTFSNWVLPKLRGELS